MNTIDDRSVVELKFYYKFSITFYEITLLDLSSHSFRNAN